MISLKRGTLVNTLLSCIGVYDINYSLRPKWKPPFIDVLVPEDRCHLNGMTLEDGIPKFATALSKTNSKEGWRVDKMTEWTAIGAVIAANEDIDIPTILLRELYRATPYLLGS